MYSSSGWGWRFRFLHFFNMPVMQAIFTVLCRTVGHCWFRQEEAGNRAELPLSDREIQREQWESLLICHVFESLAMTLAAYFSHGVCICIYVYTT